ncbi:CDP-glucose 4,6-dehydratase [uncultured Pseudodesulfovibrio sp.]|uniref:CDP-glucose 4,6-dehydratase n=1 Tax=uncultured Pseudodesulfovibrio sp. TaxID=2035858 RepID=UPI0029C78EB3|nr:CDP-glucose 4,6-dehydratase [uncultured Pseudodesulfovibrio sp.]
MGSQRLLGPPGESFWAGKRVFLTGESGFKGSWLSLWLLHLGAKVVGFSLPEDNPMFSQARGFIPPIDATAGDIRDYTAVRDAMQACAPDIVIHFAAQPLVRLSYKEPLFTFGSNVMGTANILEAVRQVGNVRSVVIITTDKCYADQQWLWPYRENDRLGGHDPYSASKACAELVTSSFRSSFFDDADAPGVATARAGNVIGGGDWAEDRLIPDIVRAFLAGKPVHLRRPDAVRPWQHVLEPLNGYLQLAEKLWSDNTFAESWNFGPTDGEVRSVEWMMRHFAEFWGTHPGWTLDEGPHPHETELLRLDCSKAQQRLGWGSIWGAGKALQVTADWYRRQADGEDPLKLAEEQIASYVSELKDHVA